jgi:hypothetical protein
MAMTVSPANGRVFCFWPALCLVLCAGGPAPAQPAAPPMPEPPAGRRFDLACYKGEIFVPEGFKPAGEAVDLHAHFHGTWKRVEPAFVEAKRPGVLVTVSIGAGSKVYEAPFREKDSFQKVLAEVLEVLDREKIVPGAKRGRLTMSAFSAGFGAVREILRREDEYAAVEALVLADTLHAGYDAAKKPDPVDMAPFVRYAKDAAAGKKELWVTHSAVVPPGYASTTETADALIEAAGVKREKTEEKNALGMALSSKADKRRFHVRGYDGRLGPDHMMHLYNLAEFFRQVE